jgi:uncharacterized membrane protein
MACPFYLDPGRRTGCEERMERKPEPQETRIRSLTKAMTYRILIAVLHFTVILLLTGNFGAAIGFSVLSSVYTTIAYYFHERLWSGIAWGTKAAAG